MRPEPGMRQNDVLERSKPAPHVLRRSGHAGRGTSRSLEARNRRLLRARDAMDRTFAEPLCVPRLAQIAEESEAPHSNRAAEGRIVNEESHRRLTATREHRRPPTAIPPPTPPPPAPT